MLNMLLNFSLSATGDRAFPVAASQLCSTATEHHVGAVTDLFFANV